MSAYLKLSTLEYPRHEGDIRFEYPEILESQTGDAFPCPPTYALVTPTQRPIFNPVAFKCVSGAPVQVNGAWKTTWVVVPLTPQELNFNAQQEVSFNLLDKPGSAPNVIE